MHGKSLAISSSTMHRVIPIESARAFQRRKLGSELLSPEPFNARDPALVAAIVRPPALIHKDQHLARIDDRLIDLHVVQSGSFKAYALDSDGREHVRDFLMPGQLIGLDAIETGHYRANIMALETSSTCSVSYCSGHTIREDTGLARKHPEAHE